MARIIKLRVVPRGYMPLDDGIVKGWLAEISEDYTPSDFFMALYMKYGTPMKKGLWSYMLRHNNVVIMITAADRSEMRFSVWVSPQYFLDARRMRTRATNVVARRLNGIGVVFMPSDSECLYYSVRKKNDVLRNRSKNSPDELKAIMLDSITGDEKRALYGPESQYMPDVRDELRNIIERVFCNE